MSTDLERQILADLGLQARQKSALCRVREVANVQHAASLPRLRERVRLLGFSYADADATLEWIEKRAPIIIPVDLEKIGIKLLADTHFRNQFETESCDAMEDWRRAEWEEVLFQAAYQDAPPASRCKYGVLNVTNDTSGVQNEKECSATSYLLLRNVRHRTTFAISDSAGHGSGDLKYMDRARVATSDYYAHVLEEYTDAELRAVVGVGLQRSLACSSIVMETCKEAHIHGDVKLSENVEVIMVNSKLRERGVTSMLERLSERCQAPFIWMEEDGPALVPSSPSKSFGLCPARRKPSVGYGVATPCPAVSSPASAPPSADYELERALKASLQCAEAELHDRDREAKDLARAMQLSASTAQSHCDNEAESRALALASDGDLYAEDDAFAKAIEASMLATSSAILPFSNPTPPPATFSSSKAVDDSADVEYVLKASFGDDVRRFRLLLSIAGSLEEVATSIHVAVCESFDLAETNHFLKYEDEDGDLCTLVATTIVDYLSLRQGNQLKKVRVCCVPQQDSPVCTSSSIVQGCAGNDEGPSGVPMKTSNTDINPRSPMSTAAGLAESNNDEHSDVESETIHLPEHSDVESDNDGDSPTCPMPIGQQCEAMPVVNDGDADAESSEAKADEVGQQASASPACLEAVECEEEEPPLLVAEAEKVNPAGESEHAAKASEEAALSTPSEVAPAEAPELAENASEEATPSTPSEVQEFSMVTPPASPRGNAAGGNPLLATSIEDEYQDEHSLWTFVAEAAE